MKTTETIIMIDRNFKEILSIHHRNIIDTLFTIRIELESDSIEIEFDSSSLQYSIRVPIVNN